MNKKVILSVLSTALVTSMATSAFAASGGVYIGGNVDRHYSDEALLKQHAMLVADLYDSGLENVEDNVLFVNWDGEVATLQQLIDAKNAGKDADFKPVTSEDFEKIGGEEGFYAVDANGNVSTEKELQPEQKPVTPGDLVVESVSAITTTIAQGTVTEAQFLQVAVNEGTKVTVADLEKAGYTVDFQATRGVFPNNASTSATGELKNDISKEENFKYKVVVSKDNEKFESALVSVTVLDAQLVIEPTEVKLFENNAAIDKGYATLGQDLSISITKGKNFAGEVLEAEAGFEAGKLAAAAVYTSSQPSVALVSTDGKLNLLKEGTSIITVIVGEKTISFDLVVKATPVVNTIQETTAKLQSTEKTLKVTVLDQHGAEFKLADVTGLTVATQSGKNVVSLPETGALEVDNGKLVVNFEKLTEGTDTLVIKNGEKQIGTVAVTVVNVADKEVDSYKLVPANDAALTLDIFKPENKTVNLKVQKFVGDVLVDVIDNADTGFSFKSSDDKVATVNKDTGEVTAHAAGKVVISYVEGSVVVGTVEITVENSTPQITDVKLKEGKTAVVVDASKTDADLLADLFDELDVFAGEQKLSVTIDMLASIADSENAIAIKDGQVTIKADEAKDGTIVFTFADSYGNLTKDFNLKIVKSEETVTDAEVVATAKNNLTLAVADADQEISTIALTDKQDGATVTWTVEGTPVDGPTYSTPARTDEEQTVVLTATITKGSATATQTFTVTVATEDTPLANTIVNKD
ncbi:Ig-like domain-containing protein [Brevibacterium sp. JNUCC-42]|nr:Ig-like domain-containing protein [Brevibacterium sp. JNUCC-42]